MGVGRQFMVSAVTRWLARLNRLQRLVWDVDIGGRRVPPTIQQAFGDADRCDRYPAAPAERRYVVVFP